MTIKSHQTTLTRIESKILNTMKTTNIISISILYLTLHLALVTAYQDESPPASTSEGAGEGGIVLTLPSSIKPNDDPENILDIVQKAKSNELNAEMITNKSRAMVSCETGEILVRINFTEPFRGVGYADYDRSSPCKFFGEGGNYYEMKLPLKGCGTKQEAPRLFVNNIVLRFHRSLELEEDEVKTIVCRYPPPQAPAPPAPPGPPAKIVETLPEPAKLTQYEPFVIIAGLLFFALLLAGLGTTSYVTRKQTIKPINLPFPLTTETSDDAYIDKQSIVTIEELKTNVKLVPFPRLSTQLVDDIFITKIHEIDTQEDIVHHKQMIPRPHLENYDLEDTYITNQDEITEEEILRQQQLARMRQLDRVDCDDAYITNQDETIDEENLIHQKALTMTQPKLEVRTIEDTFITNVDEVIEKKNTTYLKNHGRDQHELEHYEEYEEHREGYRDC